MLIVVLAAYPYLVTASWLNALDQTIIMAFGAIALNILLGVAGQLSLGSAAIMALGAFTAAATATQGIHASFLLTMLLGAVVGGLAALLLGVIALRVRGFYLVLATIALHFIVLFFTQKYQTSVVGETGFIMPPASLFGWDLSNEKRWYVVLMVLLVLVTAGSYNLLRSGTGRAFRAIKDREVAAALLGVDVTRTKLLVFILTSMLIGLQGAVYAFYVGVVSYDTFSLDLTVEFVAMIIIGGLGSIAGSLIGALVVTMLPFVVQALVPLIPDWVPFGSSIQNNAFPVESILYGIVILIFMLRLPRGLAYSFRQLGTWLGKLSTGGRSPSRPTPDGVGRP